MIKKIIELNLNVRGFSLMEVMIGGAILAGVALAGAQLFKDQKTAQKRVDLDQHLSSFHQNLIKTLTIPANCSATLLSYRNSTIPATAAGSSINISQCATGCLDDNQSSKTNRGHLAALTATPILTPNAFIDNTNTWRMVSARVLQARNSSGPVTIRIAYNLRDGLSNNRIVNKDVILHARFFNNQFKECFNNQESSVNNLQRDLCKTLNWNETDVLTGPAITSDGKVAAWNEELQICEVGGDKDCTARGLQVGPLKADGTISCIPIVSPSSNLNSLIDASTPSGGCPAPRRPSLSFDTGTKKLKVICN